MAHAGLPPAVRAVLLDELIYGEEEMEALLVIAQGRAQMMQVALQEEEERQREPTRVEGYVEHIVPLYSNHEFKAHFRMERTTFEQLQIVLGPHLPTRMVSVEKKLLSTVWLLGNKESFRGVADRFDFNKGFLHSICMEVCEGLKHLQPQFMFWPTRYEQTHIVNSFLRKTGFPGIVGCIDGTHIQIPGPSEHRAVFINRKGFPSVQVQAVCDDNLRFLDIFAGWPGSAADARVFRNSPLHDVLEGGNLHEDNHLLGDSAYALAPYMMVPFRDNGHLTEIEINYNRCHSSARVVIERAFGLLKTKFRRLQHLDMHLVDKIPTVIMAAGVLHNFILLHEKVDFDIDLQDIPVGEIAPHVGAPQALNVIAVDKRNTLANLIA